MFMEKVGWSSRFAVKESEVLVPSEPLRVWFSGSLDVCSCDGLS